MTPVDKIHVPVPLNFILIGFNGDGNRGLSLAEDELQRWFHHMDFEEPHTRVPVDGYATDDDTKLPSVSYVHYNYSAHVVEVGNEVTKTFERALNLYRRPVDPTPGKKVEQWQVDATQMNALVESLLKEMGIESNAYNILLMNPHRAPNGTQYGYRTGFSQEEIDYLATNPEEMPSVGGSPGSATRAHGALREGLGEGARRQPRPEGKFKWHSYHLPEANDWAEKVNALLAGLESTRGVMVKGAEGPRTALREDAASLAQGSDPAAAAYVKRIVQAEAAGVHESCLVDTWVGAGRYLWADLSAGPFQWGPLVGGSGLREAHSLPSVEDHFGHLPEGRQGAALADLDAELERLADLRFRDMEEEDEENDVELINAELDVYEMFAKEHCANRQRHIPLCEELRSWVVTLEERLATAVKERAEASGAVAQEDLKPKPRPHGWSIFGSDAHAANFSVARDLFLSELGAAISGALKHAVTPSLASAPFHAHKKISVLLYVVSAQSAYKPTAPEHFDKEHLKRELSRLCLPGQTLQVAVHKMALGEDPALALAYAASLRTVVLPSLQPGGTFQARSQRYLDSTSLRHQLLEVNQNRVKHAAGEQYTSSAAGAEGATLEVPVFLFSLDDEDPVLIDKHYTAKSLSNMVLVVQNRAQTWDSRLACNGRKVTWNLRNPMRATLAAVAQHVGGVLPSHVTYSLPHARTAQSWLWATGNHPFAATGAEHGSSFSQLQVDAVHRSYILTSLDVSILAVNEGIEALARETTRAATFDLFRKLPLGALMDEYQALSRQWVYVVHYMETLDYGMAAGELPGIERHAHKFRELALGMVESMHPVICTRQRSLQLSWTHIVMIFALAVIACLVQVLRPKTFKPKIN